MSWNDSDQDAARKINRQEPDPDIIRKVPNATNPYGTFTDDDVTDQELEDAYENGYSSKLGRNYKDPKELDIHGNWNRK